MADHVDAAGVRIPSIGLGTFDLLGDECRYAVAEGLRAGYRHVDTAANYHNEDAVGDGIRASGVPRGEIFLTTKVWHDQLNDGALQRSAEASLKRLQVDQVDLLLIHWPSPDVPIAEAVSALCAVARAGLARAIGVSNFTTAMVREAVAAADRPLAVNQVEYHPYLDQSKLRAVLAEFSMGLTAYSPLARGVIMDEPVIKAAAARHGVPPAAIALAWLIRQDGVIAIPKSRSPERMRESLAALSVTLGDDEVAAIDALKRPDGRIIDPAFAPEWDRADA
ncbi:MAG: aldo/keto reductase [Pseudomonadota bacterium]